MLRYKLENGEMVEDAHGDWIKQPDAMAALASIRIQAEAIISYLKSLAGEE